MPRFCVLYKFISSGLVLSLENRVPVIRFSPRAQPRFRSFEFVDHAGSSRAPFESADKKQKRNKRPPSSIPSSRSHIQILSAGTSFFPQAVFIGLRRLHSRKSRSIRKPFPRISRFPSI